MKKHLKKIIAPIALAAGIGAAMPAYAQDDFLPAKKDEPVAEKTEKPEKSESKSDVPSIVDVLDEKHLAKFYAQARGFYGEDVKAHSEAAKLIFPIQYGIRVHGGGQYTDQITDVFNKQRTSLGRGWVGLGWTNNSLTNPVFIEGAYVGDKLIFKETAEGEATRHGAYLKGMYANRDIGFQALGALLTQKGHYDLDILDTNSFDGAVERHAAVLKLSQKLWGPEDKKKGRLEAIFDGDQSIEDVADQITSVKNSQKGLHLLVRGSFDHQNYHNKLVRGYILAGEAGLKWQDAKWFAEVLATARDENYKYPETGNRTSEFYPGVKANVGWRFSPFATLTVGGNYDDKYGLTGTLGFKVNLGFKKK